MAYNFMPDSVAVAGVGDSTSTNLIGSSTGQSISLWQLVLSGSATDTISVSWTVGGTSTALALFIGADGTIVLPYTGAAWAGADVGTAITFKAATTTTLTAYYTKGIGG